MCSRSLEGAGECGASKGGRQTQSPCDVMPGAWTRQRWGLACFGLHVLGSWAQHTRLSLCSPLCVS